MNDYYENQETDEDENDRRMAYEDRIRNGERMKIEDISAELIFDDYSDPANATGWILNTADEYGRHDDTHLLSEDIGEDEPEKALAEAEKILKLKEWEEWEWEVDSNNQRKYKFKGRREITKNNDGLAVYPTKDEAEKKVDELYRENYYLAYGENDRPTYRVRKFAGEDRYGIRVTPIYNVYRDPKDCTFWLHLDPEIEANKRFSLQIEAEEENCSAEY